MLRGYRSFILTVVGVLIAAGAIWTHLKPAYPSLPTDQYQKADDGKYSPGSPACYPSRLDRLSHREAADERYRCEQGAEERRLKSDDLVQQTRAADAAYAIVSLTYNQSLMMLAGTIFGLLTLVAAFAAVLYAKRAAEAAELDLANTKDTSKRELRAYVVGKDATAFNVTAGKRPAFMIKLHNSGQTPAYDVRCITNIFAITGDVDTEKLLFRSRKAAQMSRDIIGGNDYKTLVNPAIGDFGQDSLGLVHAGHIKLIFCGIISYRDIFDRRHLSTFRTFIQLSGDPGMARIDMTSCAKGNSGN